VEFITKKGRMIPISPSTLRGILDRVETSDPVSCWLWPGAASKSHSSDPRPRPVAGVDGNNVEVKRLFFQHYHNTATKNLFMGSVCGNPLCVNPYHTEAVSHPYSVHPCESEYCGVIGPHQHFASRWKAPYVPAEPEELFWSKVEKTETCWVWKGKPVNGYGQFVFSDGSRGNRRAGRKTYQAHIYSYLTVIGPYEEHLVLDHTCNNKMCVNPDHLEPVTIQENSRRASCKHGRGEELKNKFWETPNEWQDKFWSRVDKTDNCWTWMDNSKQKYGSFGVSYYDADYYAEKVKLGIPWRDINATTGYTTTAHSVSWFLATGSRVPNGFVLDHTCRNKKCVNPSHLEVVSVQENSRRGRSAK
jgi:hypothetical protein